VNAQPLLPISEVLRAAFAFYRANVRLILIVTFPVVAFVDVVIGAGLGELTASVHKQLSTADGYIGLAASDLVTVPLVTAMLARAVVIELGGGQPPTIRQVAEQGFDLFAPALLVVIMFVSAVLFGLILIVPGIYIAVSWYFVVQAVAVDGHRGVAAASASAALVRGRWWHTAGVLICLQLLADVASAAATAIFESLATAVNSDAVVVLGNVLIDTVALPFVAIGATLYYLELRKRAGIPAPR
jgi:hypothetical protein